MGIDSAALYKRLEETYARFDVMYENALTNYYTLQIKDIMKQLYIDNAREIKGLIFVDGTWEIGTEMLTELFTDYSTCVILCVCLSPTEREQISRQDVSKVIYFEDISLMRYMSYLFVWLENAMSANEPIIVYNNTLYCSLKNWLRERHELFHLSFSIEHMKLTINHAQ